MMWSAISTTDSCSITMLEFGIDSMKNLKTNFKTFFKANSTTHRWFSTNLDLLISMSPWALQKLMNKTTQKTKCLAVKNTLTQSKTDGPTKRHPSFKSCTCHTWPIMTLWISSSVKIKQCCWRTGTCLSNTLSRKRSSMQEVRPVGLLPRVLQWRIWISCSRFKIRILVGLMQQVVSMESGTLVLALIWTNDIRLL